MGGPVEAGRGGQGRKLRAFDRRLLGRAAVARRTLAVCVAAGLAAALLLLAQMTLLAAAFPGWYATMAAVVVSIFVALYPRVMVSTLGSANDLTVTNTSSAPYALKVMTVAAAVLVPVVLAYQGWTYYVFRRRVGGAGTTADALGPAGRAR
jgi:cytochrome bd-type quinol oxidase subunit 2